MKLLYLGLTLLAFLGSVCIGNGHVLRFDHVRRCDIGGGDTMGQDCPESSTSLTSPSPTHAAAVNYPTGRHDPDRIWYPVDAGIEVYKMMTPGKAQPYTSNGTCVNLLDYKSRKTAYIVDAFRLAPGIACQCYYLPDCQQPIPGEKNGKVKQGGFWNASMIWQPPIFSSFQCWPKACAQPIPPINYAINATATFTCAHQPTMVPVGFTRSKYVIQISSEPRQSPTTPTPMTTVAKFSSTTTVYTTVPPSSSNPHASAPYTVPAPPSPGWCSAHGQNC